MAGFRNVTKMPNFAKLKSMYNTAMVSIKEKLSTNTIKTVSLFSGAGGLDIGSINAGAKILWANDKMKDACESYRNNIGQHMHMGDIAALLPSLSAYRGVADLLIGGPPCQGFSVAGKMDINDERSQLVWSYAQAVETVQPRAFIMENVKALGTLAKWEPVKKALLKRMQDMGYSVGYCILNASDFDVPQARERIFVVGFRGNAFATPDLMQMMAPYRKKAKTVREALSVLDKAGTGNNRNTCNAKITLTHNPVLRKSAYAGMLFNGLGRPLKLDGYSATLPASMGGNKTPIIDEQALYAGAGAWVEDYHRRLLDDISVANSETVPPYMRRITVDEARVLQTFPMDYVFSGSQSSQYTQIGNAVPCNLAKAVCSMVIDVLKGHTAIRYSGLFN